MSDANVEFANIMLQRSQQINNLQIRIEREHWQRRHARWNAINIEELPNFPRLTIEYLRNLTIGTYQISLAPSYIQDTVQRQGERNEFQINILFNDPQLVHLRIFSRHRNATRYQLWIAFNDQDDDPITGYYCTCRSGARTLGCCAHVASFIWYMGYSRHQEQIRYPSTALLDIVLDAGNR